MNIKPMGAPTAPATPVAPQVDAKARAVQAFMGGQQTPEQSPVQNQNHVQPEEMGAIRAKNEQIATNDEQDQADTQEQQPERAEDPALSRQFAQLARQEKALRARAHQQEQQFKTREEAFKAKEASLQTPQTDMSKYISRDMLKQDALTALAEAGVSYEELTQQIINQQPTDPRVQSTIQKLEAKIAALEESNKTTQKSYEEQQTAQYQAAVKQIELDVKALVKNDPNFETIKATRATRDVVELITQTYEKDGYLLTVEEAAQQVEDYLADEYTKVANINKIKNRIQQASATRPATNSQKTPGATQTQQPQQTMKTLTNAASSNRQLSAKERAILAFKGEKY